VQQADGTRICDVAVCPFLSSLRPNTTPVQQLLLTKGDNNAADDVNFYDGKDIWLKNDMVVGKVQGYVLTDSLMTQHSHSVADVHSPSALSGSCRISVSTCMDCLVSISRSLTDIHIFVLPLWIGYATIGQSSDVLSLTAVHDLD
jgi:hypothetical protein